MNIDKDFFESVCTSATSASNNVFEAMSSYLETAGRDARNMLGQEMWQQLCDLAPETPESDPLCDIRKLTMQSICLEAYASAIPNLDLVLTPTGFGVVSNENVAPASYDRVSRLLTRVRNTADDTFDALLSALRKFEIWNSSMMARHLFRSVVWRGSDMRQFGIASPHRSDLVERSVQIAAAEISLKHKISPEQYDAFCDAIRTDSVSPQMDTAIDCCVKIIAAMVSEDRKMAIAYTGALLRIMETYPEIFGLYMDSTAYEANHAQGYENKKEDSCFFFS